MLLALHDRALPLPVASFTLLQPQRPSLPIKCPKLMPSWLLCLVNDSSSCLLPRVWVHSGLYVFTPPSPGADFGIQPSSPPACSGLPPLTHMPPTFALPFLSPDSLYFNSFSAWDQINILKIVFPQDVPIKKGEGGRGSSVVKWIENHR